MSLLDVQHIKKIYKTRFQGTQVEALRTFILPWKKGNTSPSWGNQGPGNRPSSIS